MQVSHKIQAPINICYHQRRIVGDFLHGNIDSLSEFDAVYSMGVFDYLGPSTARFVMLMSMLLHGLSPVHAWLIPIC